jgi:hypothetical protein
MCVTVTPNRGHNPGQRESCCAVDVVVKAWETHLKRF